MRDFKRYKNNRLNIIILKKLPFQLKKKKERERELFAVVCYHGINCVRTKIIMNMTEKIFSKGYGHSIYCFQLCRASWQPVREPARQRDFCGSDHHSGKQVPKSTLGVDCSGKLLETWLQGMTPGR